MTAPGLDAEWAQAGGRLQRVLCVLLLHRWRLCVAAWICARASWLRLGTMAGNVQDEPHVHHDPIVHETTRKDGSVCQDAIPSDVGHHPAAALVGSLPQGDMQMSSQCRNGLRAEPQSQIPYSGRHWPSATQQLSARSYVRVSLHARPYRTST